MQTGQRRINGTEVKIDDALPFTAVGVLHRLFNRSNRLFTGQYPRDGKETGLHNGIDALTHVGLLRHRVSVNAIHTDPFLNDLLLHAPRQLIPDLIHWMRGIEQEHRTLGGFIQHLKTLNKLRLMAGNKLRLVVAD